MNTTITEKCDTENEFFETNKTIQTIDQEIKNAKAIAESKKGYDDGTWDDEE